jgi:hypothetical protein
LEFSVCPLCIIDIFFFHFGISHLIFSSAFQKFATQQLINNRFPEIHLRYLTTISFITPFVKTFVDVFLISFVLKIFFPAVKNCEKAFIDNRIFAELKISICQIESKRNTKCNTFPKKSLTKRKLKNKKSATINDYKRI